MKKTFLTALTPAVLFTALFTLSACTEDDSLTRRHQELLGTWQLVKMGSISVENGVHWTSSEIKEGYFITFRDNFTYRYMDRESYVEFDCKKPVKKGGYYISEGVYALSEDYFYDGEELFQTLNFTTGCNPFIYLGDVIFYGFDQEGHLFFRPECTEGCYYKYRKVDLKEGTLKEGS